jgi:4-hydroxy-tetrahydrodipicolinate synthase
MILPVLALGGRGVISTIGNIWPAAVAAICEEFFAGNLEKSREIQLKILPLMQLLFADINPMPVKKALQLLGHNFGSCRLPLVDIDDALCEKLQAEMKRMGLL